MQTYQQTNAGAGRMRGADVLLLVASVLMLGACSDKDKRVYFDGKYYPAKAKKVKGDREAFRGNGAQGRRSGPGWRARGRASRRCQILYQEFRVFRH